MVSSVVESMQRAGTLHCITTNELNLSGDDFYVVEITKDMLSDNNALLSGMPYLDENTGSIKFCISNVMYKLLNAPHNKVPVLVLRGIDQVQRDIPFQAFKLIADRKNASLELPENAYIIMTCGDINLIPLPILKRSIVL